MDPAEGIREGSLRLLFHHPMASKEGDPSCQEGRHQSSSLAIFYGFETLPSQLSNLFIEHHGKDGVQEQMEAQQWLEWQIKMGFLI